MIDLRLECPQCSAAIELKNVDEITSGEASVQCPCGWKEQLDPKGFDGGKVVRCPVCRTNELYIQKDFPERVGVILVVVGIVGATIAWAYYSWVWTFAILFGSFAIDAALFYTRKDVTVCYRCLSQFRNMTANEAIHPFDLAIGEKYRQERMRKDQMRQSEKG